MEHRIDLRTREREEALAQLFEAQKLDTIGQLTGGVAHDFNNLLMVIQSSLNLLKKRLPPDEKNERLVLNALQATERGTALTQRLLSFARRQDLKPQAVNFGQLFDSIKDLLAKAVGPRTMVDRKVPDDLPPVLVDGNQLELALLNLFVNARDAMENGGTVTVLASEKREGRPPSLSGNRYVCIVVADTGQGMDEATLARAAEPFFTTKGVGKGTGLGLSMVHGLAAQSGGYLEIASSSGSGTQVSLWLPVAEQMDSPVHSVEAELPTLPARLDPLTVLIVDDDTLVRMGTTAMVEDLGHATVEAASAAQALDILSKLPKCDLVITDHAMPGMTGSQLAKHLKASLPQLPVVLASGYVEISEDADLQDMPRISKPFTQEQLRAAIERACTKPA